MANTTTYQLMKYTKSITFYFKPIYPSYSLSKIEWMIEYKLDWTGDNSVTHYDMGAIKYMIYNNNTTSWEECSPDFHFFHKNRDSGDNVEYVGSLTTQAFYWSTTTNPSYYIDSDGIVKVRISFNTSKNQELNNTYVKANTNLITYFNAVVLS